jgi:hypothetical protein
MKVIGKRLNDALHQVLLSERITTLYDLFHQTRQNHLLIEFEVDAVQLREASDVLANQQTQLGTFGFTLITVTSGATERKRESEKKCKRKSSKGTTRMMERCVVVVVVVFLSNLPLMLHTNPQFVHLGEIL